MPDTRTFLLLAVSLLPQTVSHAAGTETVMLQINPFLQPVLEAIASDSSIKPESKESADPMQLRGTMLAGSNSVANIDGTIIGIGQQVNGYTLVSVQQRHVMLNRDGTQLKLSIDSEKGSND